MLINYHFIHHVFIEQLGTESGVPRQSGPQIYLIDNQQFTNQMTSRFGDRPAAESVVIGQRFPLSERQPMRSASASHTSTNEIAVRL
jgi:hypothetical protein